MRVCNLAQTGAAQWDTTFTEVNISARRRKCLFSLVLKPSSNMHEVCWECAETTLTFCSVLVPALVRVFSEPTHQRAEHDRERAGISWQGASASFCSTWRHITGSLLLILLDHRHIDQLFYLCAEAELVIVRNWFCTIYILQTVGAFLAGNAAKFLPLWIPFIAPLLL